jgi:hypothetical protein
MGKLLFKPDGCFWKETKRIKVDIDGWAEEGREGILPIDEINLM